MLANRNLDGSLHSRIQAHLEGVLPKGLLFQPGARQGQLIAQNAKGILQSCRTIFYTTASCCFALPTFMSKSAAI